MNISTITAALDLYKTPEDDDASKPVFKFIAEVMDSYTDGKLDIDAIVKAISRRSPKELAELVKQAELIVAKAQKVSETLAEE